jgi:serine/threonine protein kinase
LTAFAAHDTLHPPVSHAAGDSIGPYVIRSRIGAGGMGQVYLAEQVAVGRKVALKVIHQELAHDRDMIARFFNEARAVTRIGHEHIVEIYDLGQAPGGEYFIVMEFLDGENLAQAMARTQVLETSRALHIAAQVADALGAAHRNAIVHRDLKPDNIMLTSALGEPDYVKVLDFGLAKMYSDMGGQPLTARGVIVGTPQYMAPEACETGTIVDYRADIYSLGVLLFQMSTGHLPFDGRTMGEVLIQQVSHLPPAPRGLNAEIPPAVEQIILRCLGKAAAARFQTMDELRAALLHPDQYLASGPPIMQSAALSDSDKARTLIRERPDTLDPERTTTQVRDTRPLGRSDTQSNLVKPVVPANRTMRLASPPPIKRKRMGRRWLALGAVMVAGLMIVLAALSSASDISETGSGGHADAGPSSPDKAARTTTRHAALDAAHEQATEPDGRSSTVRMYFKTEPAGAKIIDQSGLVLGITPVTIELPRDHLEHVLIFRHADAEDRDKTVIADQDGSFEIELDARKQERNPRKQARPRATTESQ